MNTQENNDRLVAAIELAAEYQQLRNDAAKEADAAANYAAELLGIEFKPDSPSGQSTTIGLGVLASSTNPIETILKAIVSKDRLKCGQLYWAFDAVRRSAAVHAYRTATDASTAEEAAKEAAGLLNEPYGNNTESELYTPGLSAQDELAVDNETWEKLALLLGMVSGQGARRIPKLARFWVFEGDFHEIVCDTWEEVEDFLANR